MENIAQKIAELRQKIGLLNDAYYVKNESLVEDSQYDSMLEELSELEATYPQFADENSPTLHIGDDRNSQLVNAPFQSAEHRFRMMSLANTYSAAEVEAFMARIAKELPDLGFDQIPQYCCELKFDGAAISLTYINGELTQAITRGDGATGDDVTVNIKTIKSIPQKLKGAGYPPVMEVRGEIYMPFAVFGLLNELRLESGQEPFANPRNAASGTLKLLDPRIVSERKLECVTYAIACDDSAGLISHHQALDLMSEWGLPVSSHSRVFSRVEDIMDFINQWDTRRFDLPFATDGIVIKVDSYTLQGDLGSTAKAPRWAVAYKFKAENATTRLLSIDYSVGRTGAITPVANLEPVQLSGSVVRRASLHNAEQIELLDIRVGDMVYVEKGGEIIPKITSVDLAQRPAGLLQVTYITHCPDCGTLLVKHPDEAKHYCPNADGCVPQIEGRIVHFISRKAMNIDGLGQETIALMCRSGLLHNVADIYDLKSSDLLPLERMGEKSVENILEGISASKNIEYARVLFAIGIRFVGETTAKKLAQAIYSIELLAAASREQLLEIDEVGPTIADSIIEFFAQPANSLIIQRLSHAGLQLKTTTKQQISNTLTGLKIVVTGSFENYSRQQIKELIENHAGLLQSSVSKNTDLMVMGSGVGPSKLMKATQLGIRMISESDLLAML